ncbi:AAA family ATPase [Hydrogenimonas cancrithermarum]|uniref:Nuclease SbcCD subunit C n=1 Tax=Hydrogenimonas cancrithermarum TaxID=2993563 RepID=A0ABN6WZV5_9BACT|nr:AAA family ATPase [Hydrogenimonas cancrithermarum]BDY14009.1 nuclease SbcCD subunit C [Hydrogenimonas cancrithermarum]
MKILRLRSRNINSLKGENEIDFVSFLNGSSLFAITGETGSGKTTLLDVITCALYGRTARLSKGSEVQELMSRGTGEAMCEVEFEVKGKHYRSSWTLRRARGKPDGNFQSAKMELVSLPNEEIIEAKASKVPKKIEALTGLDFDRFTQSMMLAQGGFDAFLKAEEKERSKLLEKITGTKIYSEISKIVFERAREGREVIKLIETELGAIGCLPEEESRELEKMLTEKNEEEKRQKVLVERAQKVYEIKHTFVSLQKDMETYTKDEATAQQEIERSKTLFEKLTLSDKALSVSAVYERKKEMERSLEESTDKLKSLKEEVATLTQKKRTLEAERAKMEALRTQGKADYETLSAKIQKARELQSRLDETRKQIVEKERDITKKEGELAATRAKLDALTEKEAKLKDDIGSCEAYRNGHRADRTLVSDIEIIATLLESHRNDLRQIEEITKRIDETKTKQTDTLTALSAADEQLKQRKTEADEAARLYEEADRHVKSLEAQEERLQQSKRTQEAILARLESFGSDTKLLEQERENYKHHMASMQSLTVQKDALNGKIETMREHLQTLQTTKEKELLIQKYEKDRKRLQEGEACFLCGSTEQPYIEHSDALTASETDDRIFSLQRQLTEEESRLTELERKLGIEETQANSAQLEYQKIEARIAEHESFFKAHDVVVSEESEANVRESMEAAASKLSRLTGLRTKRDALLAEKEKKREAYLDAERVTGTLRNDLSRLERDLEHDKENLKKHQQSLGKHEEKLNGYWNIYGLSFEISTLMTHYTQLKQRKAAYERNEKALQESTEQYNKIKLEIGTHTSTIKSEERTLDTMRKEFKTLRERAMLIEQAKKEVLDVEDIEAYTASVEKKWQEIQQAFNALSNDFHVTTAALLDRELIFKTTSEAHLKKQEESEKLTEGFNSEMKKKGFESEQMLEDALLPEAEREALRSTCEALNSKLTEAMTRKRDTEAKLTALQDKDISDKTLEVLLEEKRKQEELYGALREALGKIKSRLDTDAQNRQRHKAKLEELADHRESQQVWEKLNELIGASDGAKFAKFAQGITLDQLIYLANKHLAFLSDRYAIVRLREEGQQLEIAVIDKYQGDEIRPSNTLSGGESFLVSLSLALGLSELASQKISIDSLFLDEGFGTLDTDTLDIALNALNMLESRGKMVGVISHVETMKERIPLQIKIHKSGGGESRVELVGQTSPSLIRQEF